MKKIEGVYNPAKTEDKIYQFWEKGNYFKPKIKKDAKPFVISMPPPNITGNLHIGHALTLSIEDTLIRYNRMKQIPTLWIPGVDHAGIATQNVIEKQLKKEGKNRHILGREKFLKRVWQWVDEYGNNIDKQIRKMGSSCDWNRKRFTLDKEYEKAVIHEFVSLYKAGLIYKGEYIINWCPRCETVVSDIEVIYKEEKSFLYYIKYPFVDQKGGITVATTRPETMLGDTAVAVSHKDKRYKKIVGKTVRLPFVNREIPIIADKDIDPEFGTGAVKITPAHDPLDYEIGKRHRLQEVVVIGFDGKMTSEAGGFKGLNINTARDVIITELEKMGLIKKKEKYLHSVGHCERCNTTIEPMISKQWFVKIDSLAKPAIEAAEKRKVEFVPDRFRKVYLNWMNNIHDWVISRQLWWGHQIPVWYCDECDEEIIAETEQENCPNCQSIKLTRDPDVLDTWFSSALWPFAALGWPKNTPDYKYFYPTSVLETGYDIIFFWVARMIISGLYFTKKAPFEKVYLHGLVRDIQGRKMSKSLGNVINPLDIIDKYGTDALRLSLIVGQTPGNDLKISDEKIRGNKNFINKIWNISRFISLNLDKWDPSLPESKKMTNFDRWIISRIQNVIKQVSDDIENFKLSQAGNILYDFIWNEFADWYLEIAKVQMTDQNKKYSTERVLSYCLANILKMLHPFIPFITEEIWQTLVDKDALISAEWPKEDKQSINKQVENYTNSIIDIIKIIRVERAKNKIEPAKLLTAYFSTNEKFDKIDLDVMKRLARLEDIIVNDTLPSQKGIIIKSGNTDISLII